MCIVGIPALYMYFKYKKQKKKKQLILFIMNTYMGRWWLKG